MRKGTYVGVRVLPGSASTLAEYCKQHGIQMSGGSQWERRLHSTIIYSRNHCPNLVADPKKLYVAYVMGFEFFTSDSGEDDVLVVRLDCPQLVGRHLELMRQHNATYDHAQYRPHVTLSYDASSVKIENLTPIKFPILLGLEYCEDLRFGESE